MEATKAQQNKYNNCLLKGREGGTLNILQHWGTRETRYDTIVENSHDIRHASCLRCEKERVSVSKTSGTETVPF